MAKATTTTYLEIESIGADKLISTMAVLQKSLNFVAGMLKDLNKGLGFSSTYVKKGSEALDAQARSASEAAAQATQLRVAMAQQMATTADLAKTVKSLGDEQKKQSKALDWQAVASKVQLAKQAYEAIKGSLISAGQEAMRVAQAWEVQEAAEMRMAAAIQNNPIQGQLQSYKDWASAIQSTTKYGDEQVLTLAAQAAKMAKSEAQTKATTKAALDWAAATGGQAEQALRAMGGAMSGNSDSLRQLGLYLTEAEKQTLKQATEEERLALITDKLTQSYGGFAEALATTPTGALKQAQNLLGDIDEQVGRLVSPALYAGLSVVQDYLQGQLDDLLKITDNAESLDNVQRDILGLLQATGRTMIDLKTVLGVIKNSVEILAGALWTAFSAPLKPIGLLLEQLAKIPGLGKETRQTIGDLAYAISGPFDMSVAGIKADIKDIQALIADGRKEKEAFEASTYKAFEKYQAMAKKRQEAAGLGGGPGDGEGEPSGGQGRGAGTAQQSPLPSESQLDKEFAQMETFMAKIEALAAEFAAKRKALEDSQLIDTESKNAMRLQLETQEQEEERQLKLQYAQETGDQLTLLEDQYRQERLAKEKELAAQQKAVQEDMMKKVADGLGQLSNIGLDMLTGWIEGTGDWKETLYNGLKSMSKNLMSSAISRILELALINQGEAMSSQAGIPIVGPALALAAGAAMFATTMALKNQLKPAELTPMATGGYISAGMVKGGAYGRDSVPALLEPGERVLSKKETEAYDNRQAQSQPVNIVINVSGQLSTPGQITDTVRRVLVPELRAAARAGYAI